MQRQAMGVALHIVLLPFLNYCIARLIRTTPTNFVGFFFACFLGRSKLMQEAKGGDMKCDPFPAEPVPVTKPHPRPDPVPHEPVPDPDPHPLVH